MAFVRLGCSLIILASLASSVPLRDKNETETGTVILVSFAGLGWQFVGSDLTHTPNFDFIVQSGVKAKNMVPVHPTRTAPIHTTFLTGLYPESHGIVDNMFWDPIYEERFIHSDDCSNFDPKFYNESEPIWLTMQKQGENTASYFWPGSYSYKEKPTYATKPVCYVNCDHYSGRKLENLREYMRVHCTFDWSDPFSNRVDKVLEWVSSNEPPKLALLYIDEPDWKGHAYGPHSPQYRQMIEMIDRDVVGRLLDGLYTAKLLNKVNIILVSDHSLIETSNKRQIRLNHYITSNDYYENRGTTEQLWPKPGQMEKVLNALSTANNSHLKIYKKRDFPDNWHWKNNRRIPPLYLDVEEGWLMRTDYDAAGEGEWIEGSHVWSPSQNSAGIFYARGPFFKANYSSPRSLRAVDLYPLLCHILGVKPRSHNGSLSSMMEFLKMKSLEVETNTSTGRNPQTLEKGTDISSGSVDTAEGSTVTPLSHHVTGKAVTPLSHHGTGKAVTPLSHHGTGKAVTPLSHHGTGKAVTPKGGSGQSTMPSRVTLPTDNYGNVIKMKNTGGKETSSGIGVTQSLKDKGTMLTDSSGDVITPTQNPKSTAPAVHHSPDPKPPVLPDKSGIIQKSHNSTGNTTPATTVTGSVPPEVGAKAGNHGNTNVATPVNLVILLLPFCLTC